MDKTSLLYILHTFLQKKIITEDNDFLKKLDAIIFQMENLESRLIDLLEKKLGKDFKPNKIANDYYRKGTRGTKD